MADLTERETSLVKILVSGASNQEAAELLGVSLRTAEQCRQTACEKLGAASAAQLGYRFCQTQPDDERIVIPLDRWSEEANRRRQDLLREVADAFRRFDAAKQEYLAARREALASGISPSVVDAVVAKGK